MADYVIITSPGIGEPQSLDGKPIGLLKAITDHLPTRFEKKHFNWRNQFGPVPVWNGTAYNDNLEGATDALVQLVEAQTKPVILAGYSGGAHVVSRAAAANPSGLAGVVTVANPQRRAGDSEAPFWGITGAHVPFSVPLLDLANPADVIPCCPPTNPLRDFYDLAQRFSLADPKAWGKDVLKKASLGLLTNSVREAKPWDWWLAFCYARGYLWDGQHTTWYVERAAPFAATIASQWS